MVAVCGAAGGVPAAALAGTGLPTPPLSGDFLSPPSVVAGVSSSFGSVAITDESSLSAFGGEARLTSSFAVPLLSAVSVGFGGSSAAAVGVGFGLGDDVCVLLLSRGDVTAAGCGGEPPAARDLGGGAAADTRAGAVWGEPCRWCCCCCCCGWWLILAMFVLFTDSGDPAAGW